jgi:hypothetical protein
MGGRWLYLTLVPVFAFSVGCFGPSDEAQARLAETKASGEALIAKFDTLEDRFLSNQATVKLYDELRLRHASVSEIACKNQDNHYAQMVEHMEKTTEKSRKLRRRHVAEVDAVSLTRTTKRNAHD